MRRALTGESQRHCSATHRRASICAHPSIRCCVTLLCEQWRRRFSWDQFTAYRAVPHPQIRIGAGSDRAPIDIAGWHGSRQLLRARTVSRWWIAIVAEIPSDIASSAAQAGFQAREAAKNRDAQRASQAHVADRQVKAASQAGDTVETEDGDSQVFTDSEGAGGQGRDFGEDSAAADVADGPESSSGVTRDDDGRLHLDLEA